MHRQKTKRFYCCYRYSQGLKEPIVHILIYYLFNMIYICRCDTTKYHDRDMTIRKDRDGCEKVVNQIKLINLNSHFLLSTDV